MSANHIQTTSLKLIPLPPEEVCAWVEAMAPSEKAQLSTDWLARLHASTSTDPWTHGFSLVHRDSDIVVGRSGFKGPPAADGVVEIAYGVIPNYQGKGYATEAVQALVAFAFTSGRVHAAIHAQPDSARDVVGRDQSASGARQAIYRHERHVQPRPIFPAEKAVAHLTFRLHRPDFGLWT